MVYRVFILQREQNEEKGSTANESAIEKADWKSRLDDWRLNWFHEAVVAQRVHDRNGTHTCNPYVSVRLVPDVRGTQFQSNRIAKVKTRAVERTLFPL